MREALALAADFATSKAPEHAHFAPHRTELEAARTLIAAQLASSAVPSEHELLIEQTTSREGHHIFVFPFEGRLVHAGLAALCALRLARLRPCTFSFAVSDYGFELLTSDEAIASLARQPGTWRTLFASDNLLSDVASSISMTQLARLAFRDVARVAGLVLQNYPGARRTGKQVQASSGLIFDVLSDFEPENLLLHQARREVLDRHFEASRLARTLVRLQAALLRITSPARLTPLAFPLVVEREASKLSSQSIAQRVEAMRAQWESC
jgi:ATP-dependent Lhr-like helicase